MESLARRFCDPLMVPAGLFLRAREGRAAGAGQAATHVGYAKRD
jgi:hypothetical protein